MEQQLKVAVRRLFDAALVVLVLFAGVRLFATPARSYASVESPELFHGGSMVLGTSKAPIQLVVWSDYQCPFCQRLALQLDSLRARHPDSLVVYYRHLFGETHAEAERLGLVAECAARAGRFADVHQALFVAGRSGQVASGIPTQVGAALTASESQAVDSCLADSAVVAHVRAQSDSGRQLGIRGTPTTLIARWLVTGAPLSSQQLWDSVLAMQ